MSSDTFYAREEFELLLKRELPYNPAYWITTFSNEHYLNAHAEYMWTAWKAAIDHERIIK